MTTVVAIAAMLESGSSVRETMAKSCAARALVDAVFLALIDQGEIPQICVACGGHGAKDGELCRSCRGSGCWSASK